MRNPSARLFCLIHAAALRAWENGRNSEATVNTPASALIARGAPNSHDDQMVGERCTRAIQVEAIKARNTTPSWRALSKKFQMFANSRIPTYAREYSKTR